MTLPQARAPCARSVSICLLWKALERLLTLSCVGQSQGLGGSDLAFDSRAGAPKARRALPRGRVALAHRGGPSPPPRSGVPRELRDAGGTLSARRPCLSGPPSPSQASVATGPCLAVSSRSRRQQPDEPGEVRLSPEGTRTAGGRGHVAPKGRDALDPQSGDLCAVSTETDGLAREALSPAGTERGRPGHGGCARAAGPGGGPGPWQGRSALGRQRAPSDPPGSGVMLPNGGGGEAQGC